MHRRLLAPIVLAAVAVAACSDDAPAAPADPSPSGSTSSSTAAPATTAAPSTAAAPSTTAPGDPSGAGIGTGTDWSIGGALAEVPDAGADEFTVWAADVAQVATLFALERPASVDDVDAVLDEWVLPLSFPGTAEYRSLPVWIPLDEPLLPRVVDRLGEFDDTLGWSVVDVDAYVHYLPSPVGYFTAAAGQFADDALAGLPEVAPGVVTTREGDDFATDFSGSTAVDQLGRPVRAARDGDVIALSLATPLVEQWLADGTETLADDPQLAAIAAALDAHGVLTAQIFRYDFRAGAVRPQTPEETEQVAELVAAIPEFDTVAVGWAVDDAGEPLTVVVYGTPGDGATALAEQLATVYAEGTSLVTRQPVTEAIGAADPEIVADGSVVTVTYRPQDRFWAAAVQAVISRDLPFVHR